MKQIKKWLLITAFSLFLSVGASLSIPFFSSEDIPFGLNETRVLAAQTKSTTTSLNLRGGPGTTYPILTIIPKEADVTVLSTSGGWSKVEYGGITGYVSSAYLSSSDGKVYLTTSAVNLRRGPSTSYAVISKIPKGSAVSVQSISKSWAKLTYRGTTGYSHSSYLLASASYITTGNVNLRSGPGTGYGILLKIPSGATVAVFATSANWARLAYKGTVGYSSLSYLKAAGVPAEQSTPPDEPDSSEGSYSQNTIKQIDQGITSSSSKRLSLTFDDGLDTIKMDYFLDLLDQYDARSTFFFTGEWVKANPEYAREILKRGHTLGSHTVSHPDLVTLSEDEIRYQLTRSRDIINDTVGVKPAFFRPPYGSLDDRVVRIAGEAGYEYIVLWNIYTAENLEGSTVESVTRKAIDGAKHNGILLLHPDSSKAMEALPVILKSLKEAGYRFVRVDDMLP